MELLKLELYRFLKVTQQYFMDNHSLIIGLSCCKLLTPKLSRKFSLKLCVKLRLGHGKIMVAKKKIAPTRSNFEKERCGWMAWGVSACRQGFGCNTFLHTRARARLLACYLFCVPFARQSMCDKP